MKTQMRFQKILMLVSLILGALGIVYALIFCSGIINQISALTTYETEQYVGTSRYIAGATALYNSSQSFSDLFLILGVVLLLVIVLLYITACQKRRRYYITNYVAIGIAVVYELIYVVLLFVNVAGVQADIGNIDLEQAQFIYETYSGSYGDWNDSLWMIIVGYVLGGLILLDAVAIGLNLLWKVKLMQGEKALLQSGLVKEVA